MSRSRSRSTTSALLPILLVAAGCGDDAPTCGPLGAPASGLVAANPTASLTFENFVASANNDCPDQANPGVTSLTIIARETGGSGFLTICIPHPELANEPTRVLGADQSSADFQLVDLTGAANSCTFKLATTSAPTGTGQTEGLCDAGTNPAGFALALDGALTLERTCAATIDTVDVTLTGRVAVTVP